MRATATNSRRAVATLELVLSLPVILTLMVGLVWLGFNLVAQVQVNTEARHLAWERRFDPWPGRDFDFSDSDHQTQQSASKSVQVTPLLDGLSQPKADCTLEYGPWDHRSLAFDSFPNFRLSADMILAAKTTGIAAEVDDLQQALQSLRNVGDTALQDALRDIASEFVNPRSLLESGAESGKRRAELDQQLAVAKATAELKRLREEVKSIKERADSDDEDSDMTWLLEQQLERLKVEIALAQQQLSDLKG